MALAFGWINSIKIHLNDLLLMMFANVSNTLRLQLFYKPIHDS